MTRVVVVADSSLLRAALERSLGAEPGVSVVAVLDGVHGDGATLAAQVAGYEADVVFWAPDALDHGVTSLGLGDEEHDLDVHDARPAVVVLSGRNDGDWARRTLRDGARAVLSVDAAPDEIVAVMHAVASGLVVMPRELAWELLAGVGVERESSALDTTAPLTPREREVLTLLAQGHANKAIAPRLGITEHTVKAHVAAIYDKLGARNRAEAVMAAARQGLVML
jgi:DNA-binding NarL/FixJ family response regulator